MSRSSDSLLLAAVQLEVLGLYVESEQVVDALAAADDELPYALEAARNAVVIRRPGALKKHQALAELWDWEGGVEILASHGGDGDATNCGRVPLWKVTEALRMLEHIEVHRIELVKLGLYDVVEKLMREDRARGREMAHFWTKELEVP